MEAVRMAPFPRKLIRSWFNNELIVVCRVETFCLTQSTLENKNNLVGRQICELDESTFYNYHFDILKVSFVNLEYKSRALGICKFKFLDFILYSQRMFQNSK